MSRIGRKPIEILDNVQVTLDQGLITVKGPKGVLTQKLHPEVHIVVAEKQLVVSVTDDQAFKQKALWGLFRSLINNMVIGVTTGFQKKLEINGVGYKASASGRKVVLNVGYSHPVEFHLPEGVTAAVEKNIITLSGTDKQVVGEVAANIRRIRKPEPYKGKGIKYVDEVLRRKAGKAGKAGSKGAA